VLGRDVAPADMAGSLCRLLPRLHQEGCGQRAAGRKLLQFDLKRLGAALKAERDLQFDYLGLQTLYDRYFLHVRKTRIELPQAFFMRVAMGLALNEIDREARAIEFYEVLSSFDFMSSTPTLFNSGTLRSQLSSCYLTTVPDDLDGIYESIKENALLSKFAGGLGNDWTRVRALGSHIKGTNGESQGVVPFLKVVNDTAVAVNQGGKRKGAVCTYLETWHLDIEEFLELRKNTGDDRRRTHDMNTANWIPDLFMRRVMEKGDLDPVLAVQRARPARPVRRRLREGLCRLRRKGRAAARSSRPRRCRPPTCGARCSPCCSRPAIPGSPSRTPATCARPQQHAGVVHSSNLCTEITLNTSDTETAVCNLGSVNLLQHLKDGKVDHDKLKRTISTAMRMLDNVIDINYYAVKKARDSNLRHRPVGLG
jgi:ribonucleoside-diphosphate reductase alpha chain